MVAISEFFAIILKQKIPMQMHKDEIFVVPPYFIGKILPLYCFLIGIYIIAFFYVNSKSLTKIKGKAKPLLQKCNFVYFLKSFAPTNFSLKIPIENKLLIFFHSTK